MFTAKATEKEAHGVAELRKRVTPDMLDPADADYLDTDNAYLRHLRARNGDVEKAAEMLAKTIEWRKREKPYALTADDVQKCMKRTKMAYGGRCKAGFPVIVMAPVDADGLTMEERKRNLHYLMEETRRKGYDRVTWIVTYAYFSKEKEENERKKGENERQVRKEIMQSLMDHYPERLEKLLLFNTPFIMKVMLTFVRFVLSKTTSAKVHAIGSSVKDLEKSVARDQLPSLCEGTMTGTDMVHFSELPDLRAQTSK